MYASRLRVLVLAFLCGATVVASAQAVIKTLPVGSSPSGIAMNTGTNRIYVANTGSVTVIDATSDHAVATVGISGIGTGVAVDNTRNRIYVSEFGGSPCLNCVAVIDGATNSLVQEVPAGAYPVMVAVNAVTNKIYVPNYNDNTVTAVDGTTLVPTTIPVGRGPTDIAINSITNQIYVAEFRAISVAVIDGATNNVTQVPVGAVPMAVAVNSVTNQIYVSNEYDAPADIAVIDGATLGVDFVTVGGQFSSGIAVDTSRNKVYVVVTCSNNSGACSNRGALKIVDGGTHNVSTVDNIPSYQIDGCLSVFNYASCPTIAVDSPNNNVYITGSFPGDASNALTKINLDSRVALTTGLGDSNAGIVFNPSNHHVYVPNNGDNTVSIVDPAVKLQFVPMVPCRVVDTRRPDGTFGGPPIQGGADPRAFPLPQGSCNIPANAIAYSLNATVVPHGRLGYLTLLPSSQMVSSTSLLNSFDGRIKAAAVIVQGGVDASVSAYASDTTDLVLDINGYFIPSNSATLAFFPLAPCRVADTRRPVGPLGGPSLQAGIPRDFPVLEATACNIPDSAQAYSLNFTAVPSGSLAYLTIWPAGESKPLVSTLNDPTGTVVANAAIVPAGTNGAVSAYASNNTDLVIDINGYFASAGSGANPLSFYSLHSCRLIDTRNGRGGEFSGELVLDVEQGDTNCAVSSEAEAYALNATVIPTTGYLGYLTLWPDGEDMPVVSTLNALDGAVTSNMALVPTTNGMIDVFSTNLTQLLLDISGYFAQ